MNKKEKTECDDKKKKTQCTNCPNGVCEDRPVKSKIIKKFGLKESAKILME